MDLIKHIQKQKCFSYKTFGPGRRTKGIIDHIKKELGEIEQQPGSLEEWVDVVLLALDGAWRAGHSSVNIAEAIASKQTINEKRIWPDWRYCRKDKAIEHVGEVRSEK